MTKKIKPLKYTIIKHRFMGTYRFVLTEKFVESKIFIKIDQAKNKKDVKSIIKGLTKKK